MIVKNYSARIIIVFCVLLFLIVKTYSTNTRILFCVFLLLIVKTYSAKSWILFWVLLLVMVLWQDSVRILDPACCDCEGLLYRDSDYILKFVVSFVVWSSLGTLQWVKHHVCGVIPKLQCNESNITFVVRAQAYVNLFVTLHARGDRRVHHLAWLR